ncbi:MAG TPA: OmpA family protein [Ideonella sp.]|nr:OmpA family protein [Ideonella sp.]
MFGNRLLSRRRARDEAEKPFWISFADLMTALMVLFLVVMGVALLAVTKTVNEREQRETAHQQGLEQLLAQFAQAAQRHEGVRLDKARRVIDFGDRARFAFGKSALAPEQAAVLRRFVPEIVALANGEPGRRLLKRVVVEGYTDKTGSYLGNLDLSLQRSQRVLCAMFATEGEAVLSDEQKEQVRALFLVGGYSSNAAKDSDEESRRVEMRLEFLGLDESRPAAAPASGRFGDCALR